MSKMTFVSLHHHSLRFLLVTVTGLLSNMFSERPNWDIRLWL